MTAISHISKSGGLADWSFGLYIFDRLLLIVTLGIPVMPIVNRDYLKLVLYVYVNSLQFSTVEIRTTALSSILITQGQQVRPCLYVRHKQGELCFTVSDVGVDDDSANESRVVFIWMSLRMLSTDLCVVAC